MRRLIAGLAGLAILALAGCGASAATSTTTKDTTCWQTGQGLVIETVSTVPGCSAVYADGNPQVSGPVSGLGTPDCTYSFPTITWWVWDTDNGLTGNADSLCYTLSEDQS